MLPLKVWGRGLQLPAAVSLAFQGLKPQTLDVCAWSHATFSPGVCVHASLLRERPHPGRRPTPRTSWCLDDICREPVSKRGPSRRHGTRTRHLWRHIRPLTAVDEGIRSSLLTHVWTYKEL